MKTLPKHRQIGWQVFRRLGDDFDEVSTKRGRYAHLVSFEALCAKCGKPFMAKASKRNWRNKQLARRCERHRKLGARVNNEKLPVSIAQMPAWATPKSARKAPATEDGFGSSVVQSSATQSKWPSYLD